MATTSTSKRYQSAVIRNGRLYINNQMVEFPTASRNVKLTQVDNKIYLNGFEWCNGEWKRTLASVFHYFF